MHGGSTDNNDGRTKRRRCFYWHSVYLWEKVRTRVSLYTAKRKTRHS
jgi:hypothetical protein